MGVCGVYDCVALVGVGNMVSSTMEHFLSEFLCECMRMSVCVCVNGCFLCVRLCGLCGCDEPHNRTPCL
jgi:hypothetical protein